MSQRVRPFIWTNFNPSMYCQHLAMILSWKRMCPFLWTSFVLLYPKVFCVKLVWISPVVIKPSGKKTSFIFLFVILCLFMILCWSFIASVFFFSINNTVSTIINRNPDVSNYYMVLLLTLTINKIEVGVKEGLAINTLKLYIFI